MCISYFVRHVLGSVHIRIMSSGHGAWSFLLRVCYFGADIDVIADTFWGGCAWTMSQ